MQGPQPGAKPPSKALNPYLAILLYTIVGSAIVFAVRPPASPEQAGPLLVVRFLPAIGAIGNHWGTHQDWFDATLFSWTMFVITFLAKASLLP